MRSGYRSVDDQRRGEHFCIPRRGRGISVSAAHGQAGQPRVRRGPAGTSALRRRGWPTAADRQRPDAAARRLAAAGPAAPAGRVVVGHGVGPARPEGDTAGHGARHGGVHDDHPGRRRDGPLQRRRRRSFAAYRHRTRRRPLYVLDRCSK